MTRRMIDREYAPEECDEVCQDILMRDRIELRQRTNRNNCGCERRCNNADEVLNRRTNFAQGTRISGEECEMEAYNCDTWNDPCRCRRNCCGCQQWNRCGCRNNGCGCTRGLNCDRNRRLRSCNCNCGCNEY